MEFCTKRAAVVLICTDLAANRCSYNLLQFSATRMFKIVWMYFTIKIGPKADRLLACAVPANFHYVDDPLVPTSPLNRITVIAVVA